MGNLHPDLNFWCMTGIFKRTQVPISNQTQSLEVSIYHDDFPYLSFNYKCAMGEQLAGIMPDKGGIQYSVSNSGRVFSFVDDLLHSNKGDYRVSRSWLLQAHTPSLNQKSAEPLMSLPALAQAPVRPASYGRGPHHSSITTKTIRMISQQLICMQNSTYALQSGSPPESCNLLNLPQNSTIPLCNWSLGRHVYIYDENDPNTVLSSPRASNWPYYGPYKYERTEFVSRTVRLLQYVHLPLLLPVVRTYTISHSYRPQNRSIVQYYASLEALSMEILFLFQISSIYESSLRLFIRELIKTYVT
ncbi:uncharacterized protein BDR25DRAFT_350134 [Lindgomyces ingoldianus]|uniref:Uncharacterized protein n=1 Tax=Lindgomyces ingoldianus TaxID=673940 RepID=A0ACB6R9A9_9PLEO|nr:uncharacterized protein BDR25DRAFT_350134 [Lindgomyces ingoldianus]KAF2475859.1 hypothetical protein BDR25DRAFT_350134 [Lindgomyces ingoldianus]